MNEENDVEAENEELPEIDDAIAGEDQKPLEANVSKLAPRDLGLIMDVPLRLSVEIGSANLPVREVLELSKGSVVELDRTNGDPVDVYANDSLIARGELTVQDDRVAVRITELIAVNPATDAG